MGLRRSSPGEVVSPLVNAAPVKEATLQAEEPLPRNVEALSCRVLPAKRVSDLMEMVNHTSGLNSMAEPSIKPPNGAKKEDVVTVDGVFSQIIGMASTL